MYRGTDSNGDHLLPPKGSDGKYHLEGCLRVADKNTVKTLTAKLGPVIRALGNRKKLFIASLLCYRVAPNCDQRSHISNFGFGRYLGAFVENVQDLRLYIRDSLFTKKVCNYRVLCPNWILGLSLRPLKLTGSEAKAAADLWGSDPVPPGGRPSKRWLPSCKRTWPTLMPHI